MSIHIQSKVEWAFYMYCMYCIHTVHVHVPQPFFSVDLTACLPFAMYNIFMIHSSPQLLLSIIELFLSLLQPTCRIDQKASNRSMTPLHIAAHEGHTAVVELLVGYGADVNAAVDDGNTPLFLVMTLRKMKPLDQDTPHLKHVRYQAHVH